MVLINGLNAFYLIFQAKLAEHTKHVHSEQVKKLQAKHQQDADLLEDTRSVQK